MRRGIAGLILGLSLVVASVAWSGFVLTRTVLDPNRSERLADQVLDNDVLRDALVGRLATSMETVLPAEAAVPRQLLETAATTALDNPEVENLVRSGIVDVHRSALEGDAQPVTIDAAALGSASRQALIDARPELEAFLPAAPELEVELPVGGLSVLGTIRSFVEQATTIGAFIAIIGAATSFAIAKNRPAVLRRVSFWAFGTATFWLVVGFGIPFLAERLAPSSTAVISAFVDVFFGAMIRPGLVMAAFGAACLAGSFFWAAGSATAGARMLQPNVDQPRSRSRAPQHSGSVPATSAAPRRGVGSTQSNIRRSAPQPPMNDQQRAAAQAQEQARQRAAQQQAARQAAPPSYTQPPAQRPAPSPAPAPNHAQVDPTRVQPRPLDAEGRPDYSNSPNPLGRAPRWEPGVGYVDDNE